MKIRILLFLLYFFCFAASAHAAVVINEILYNATGSDTGNEWIELYNTGSSTISVEGWKLQVDSNAFPGDTKATLCGSIAPGGYYLIKEASTTISTSTVADLISGTLAMGNASTKADGIQLLDADDNLIDRVVYGSPDTNNLCQELCTLASSVEAGESISRSPDGADSFVAVSSDSVTPTPGGVDCSQSTEESTEETSQESSEETAQETFQETCPSGSGIISGLITEVAPAITNGDFIELFVMDPSNLCGVELYEADKLIKTFPSVTPQTGSFGSFIILNASIGTSESADETNETGDTDSDGIIDLYSDESSPGITSGSGNNLTLKSADGTIVDFISWYVESNQTYNTTKQTAYDTASSLRLWTPSCNTEDVNCYLTGSILWSNSSSESLVRKIGEDGYPKNSTPSDVTHWYVGTQSPGRGYSGTFQAKGEILEIFQSPFSPYGDGAFSESIISFKTAIGYTVTIQIYDIKGHLIQTLLDHFVAQTDAIQTVHWDGTNSKSQSVPVGIYIVHLEVQKIDGSFEKESKTVIVGRKL